MDKNRAAPEWLIAEAGLLNGVLNEEGTTLTGKPGPHLKTLLEAEGPVPAIHIVSLARMPEWRILQKRLADEGYIQL